VNRAGTKERRSSGRYVEPGFAHSARTSHSATATRGTSAEEPFVLPVEVRGVPVADAVSGTCGVEILTEHKPRCDVDNTLRSRSPIMGLG